MTPTQKVAVIGLGSIGKVVAANLAKSSRSFIAADRNIDKAKQFAGTLGLSAQPADIKAAVQEADILVLAIPFETITEFVKEHASKLEGKIIVDPSNPIAPDEKGGFKKIIAQEQSAGEINAAALAAGVTLVKALGSLGAGSLESAAYQSPEKAVLFYATDDTHVTDTIEQLIKDTGFEPVCIGGINQSIRMEVFGDLHEFGALGKTVTLKEADEKLKSSVH